jgi:hypothetical protein
MSDKSIWLLREQQLEEVIKTRRSFIHLIFLDRIFGDFQSAQSVFAIQVIIMGPPSASVTRSLLFANKTIEEYEIQLPATIVKVNKGIAMLLHAPVVLDIGQCVPANNQPSSQALLREMNKHPSLRSVQGSIETQTASTILRELDNYSLWKSSTKPKHSASYYQHQPSGLTKILSNSATHSVITARGDSTPFERDRLRTPHNHLEPVTQDDKVRECEIISTLTLTLPESTYAQGRSRSFHWDQGTNFQHIDKGVPAEYLLLTLPGHVWKVTQDDLVRECEVRCTTALTVRLSSNQGYIFSPNQAQSILAIQVRRSKPSSVDTTDSLSFAREDIEAYKIQIPTSMTLLQNIHMTSPMSSHFQPNVSGEYSNEEFSHPTALNYCQRPHLFSTEMEVASLQIQTRFLVPLSSHSKSPVRDFRPVSPFRFHMTQYYKSPAVSPKRILVSLELNCTQNLNVMAPESPMQRSLLSVERRMNFRLVEPMSS